MTELDILADDFSTDPWWWQAAPRPAPDPADELPRQATLSQNYTEPGGPEGAAGCRSFHIALFAIIVIVPVPA